MFPWEKRAEEQTASRMTSRVTFAAQSDDFGHLAFATVAGVSFIKSIFNIHINWEFVDAPHESLWGRALLISTGTLQLSTLLKKSKDSSLTTINAFDWVANLRYLNSTDSSWDMLEEAERHSRLNSATELSPTIKTSCSSQHLSRVTGWLVPCNSELMKSFKQKESKGRYWVN